VNICFVCNEYPPGPHGGIGTFTQVLGRALVRAGHQVRVIGHYSPNYPGPDYEEDQGVRVWRLRGPTSRGRWIWARYRLFRYVARWAKAGEIDLVEVPDYQGWAAFWPRLEVPVVVRASGCATCNAFVLNRPADRLMRLLERWTYIRADAWLAKSYHVAQMTRTSLNLNTDIKVIIYNLIQVPTQLKPISQRQRDAVVFAGTLSALKGVFSLCQAWSVVINNYPSASLHMYGKNSFTRDRESIRQVLESMMQENVRRSVFFHGHVGREVLLNALAESRIAVFPSYTESFGNAPIEAMACGCATIYTKRPPGPELVEDGVNGLLVDPDDPNEIADAILRLLQDDELARRLGEAGRKLVEERYSVEAMLPRNVRFYERCIADFKAKRRL